jgi:hypothetical protein
MSKMNRAVFNVLRNNINTKLSPPDRLPWDEGRRLWQEYAKKELLKRSKEKLVAMCIHECTLSDVLPKDLSDFREVPDTNKEKREQLLKEVDKAELLFLAGDNTAVLALIDKLDKL